MPSSTRKRVVIDIDGVCADFALAFTTLASELGFTEHGWGSQEQGKWEFPFNTNPVWNELKSRYNWWMTLRPILSSWEVELLNQAIDEHDIFFITTRVPTKGYSPEAQSRYWLESIGVNATRRASVIVAPRFGKGELASALNITLGIDDYVENLIDLGRYGVISVCRNQGYNQDWQGDRVPDLAEFLIPYVLEDSLP